MEIQEAKKKKEALEKAIQTLIHEFEQDTSMTVDKLTVHYTSKYTESGMGKYLEKDVIATIDFK